MGRNWMLEVVTALAGRTGQPEAPPGHRLVPCPTPPFRDLADQRAALGVAVIHVAHEVTGVWPPATAVYEFVIGLLPDEAQR